jgi:hypothetical protein
VNNETVVCNPEVSHRCLLYKVLAKITVFAENVKVPLRYASVLKLICLAALFYYLSP